MEAYIEGRWNAMNPPGMMVPFAGTVSTPPAGWLLCNGQAVSRTTYAKLFAAIGTAYGVGDNSTTFNLPDLKGRVPVGEDTGATRLAANNARGNVAGAETHKHTTTTAGGTTATSSAPIAASAGGPATIQLASSTGANAVVAHQSHTHPAPTITIAGGTAVANGMPPYQIANYLIKT